MIVGIQTVAAFYCSSCSGHLSVGGPMLNEFDANAKTVTAASV